MNGKAAISWKHDDLMHDLADHLRQPDKMIWTDMQLGPSGSPRPDVYVMRKSYTEPKPLAYEIKISVADFRSDVTSGKWQSYLAFASGVYFAVPAGLITKADVPAGCGLIVRGDGGWRVMKAPTLQPVQLSFKVMQKLLIDGVNRLVPEQRRQHYRDWIEQSTADKVLGKDVAEAVRELQRVKQRAARMQSDIDIRMELARKHANDIESRARESADRFAREGNEALAELYDFLGLEPGARIWSVQNSIADLKQRLDADEIVQAARNAINAIEGTLERARKIIGINDEESKT